MKRRFSIACFILLCFSCVLPILSQKTSAADPQEAVFFERSDSAAQHGISPDLSTLRLSLAYDPFTAESLLPGVKPWLDLLDQSSYPLKLSLPITWRSGFYWDENRGNLVSAGLLASLRLKSLPPRYGSWTLSTGLFLTRRDQSLLDQVSQFGDVQETGALGTVNISIVY